MNHQINIKGQIVDISRIYSFAGQETNFEDVTERNALPTWRSDNDEERLFDSLSVPNTF